MITVNGGSRNQKKYAFSIADFVCKKFDMSPTIEINFRRMTKDENYGYCCHLDDHEFEIDVKRTLPMREMLITLAHELVHVKQYVRGELTEDDHRDEKDSDYWDCPWEIEAHGREIGLFVRWAEEQELGHLKWTQE